MRVRVRAWIEQIGNDMFIMRTNEGTCTDPTTDVNSLREQVERINNYDEPRYIEAPDYDNKEFQEWCENVERMNELYDRNQRKMRKRNEAYKAKCEANLKDNKTSDVYVYVISCMRRGSNYANYITGGTDLLTMSDFATTQVKFAKTFKTKASAQKMIDKLSKNYLVDVAYRNMKVVQKKKEIFE